MIWYGDKYEKYLEKYFRNCTRHSGSSGGNGAVVSLSDYTAPVYGSESEDELTETETIIESAGMESAEETEVENTEAAVVLDGAFDLADGTYEGSANGFSGKIKVSVVIKNQTIRSINILSNSDDEAFFNRAKEGVTASILAKQSTGCGYGFRCNIQFKRNHKCSKTQEYQYAYAALSLTWVHLIPYREQPPITDCTGEVISVRQKLQKKMVQSSKWHIIQEQPLVC